MQNCLRPCALSGVRAQAFSLFQLGLYGAEDFFFFFGGGGGGARTGGVQFGDIGSMLHGAGLWFRV